MLQVGFEGAVVAVSIVVLGVNDTLSFCFSTFPRSINECRNQNTRWEQTKGSEVVDKIHMQQILVQLKDFEVNSFLL